MSAHNYVTVAECIDALRTVHDRAEVREVSEDTFAHLCDDDHPTAETIAKRLGGGSFVTARQRVKADRDLWPCDRCERWSYSIRVDGACPYCDT